MAGDELPPEDSAGTPERGCVLSVVTAAPPPQFSASLREDEARGSRGRQPRAVFREDRREDPRRRPAPRRVRGLHARGRRFERTLPVRSQAPAQRERCRPLPVTCDRSAAPAACRAAQSRAPSVGGKTSPRVRRERRRTGTPTRGRADTLLCCLEQKPGSTGNPLPALRGDEQSVFKVLLLLSDSQSSRICSLSNSHSGAV